MVEPQRKKINSKMRMYRKDYKGKNVLKVFFFVFNCNQIVESRKIADLNCGTCSDINNLDFHPDP